MITTMFDAPMRMQVLCTDGTTKTLDVVSFTITGTIRQSASKQKLKDAAKSEGEEKAAGKDRIYTVPEFTDDELRSLTHEGMDAPEQMATQQSKRRVLEAVVAMRRRFFKLTSLTYSVRDAQFFATMIKAGVKPSAMARAIWVASRDDWWKKQGDLSMEALSKNHARLASRYEAMANDPTEKLRAIAAKLETLDPPFAAGLRQQMDRVTPSEAPELLRRAQARLAAATTTTG